MNSTPEVRSVPQIISDDYVSKTASNSKKTFIKYFSSKQSKIKDLKARYAVAQGVALGVARSLHLCHNEENINKIFHSF